MPLLRRLLRLVLLDHWVSTVIVMGLDEVRVRMDRAQGHLDAFNTELDRFAATKPYALHVVTDHWKNAYDVEWIKGPSDAWGAIIGDVLHNVRCALDHIVYELSGGDFAADIPKHIEWPVFASEKRFFARDAKGDPGRGSGLRKIERVSDPNARTAIRRLQPYKAPDPTRHPLWVLHELNNFDKHRALHLVTGWAEVNLSQKRVFDPIDLDPGWRQTRATHGPMYVADLAPGEAMPNVSVRGDVAMYVALPPESVGSHKPLDVVLAEIINYVQAEVVDGDLGQLMPVYRSA